jgi:hypothetical protein
VYILCPKCNKKLQVPPEYAGQLVRCGSCNQAMRVPQSAANVAPTTAKPPSVTAAVGGPPQPALPPPLPQPAEDEIVATEEVISTEIAHGSPNDGPPLPAAPWLGGVQQELHGKGAWGGVGILGGVTLTFLFLAAINFSNPNPPGMRWGPVCLGVALVCFILTIVVLVDSISRLGRRVWVCANGVAWRRGGRLENCTWPEIASVTYEHRAPGIFSGAGNAAMFGALGALAHRFLATGRLTLGRRPTPDLDTSGPLHLPTGVHGMYGLAKRIAERIRPYELPGLLQSIQAGQSLGFGPHITLEVPGVRWVDKQVPWQDLHEVVVEYRPNPPSVLKAKGVRGLRDVDLGAIPNLHILLELFEHHLRIRVLYVGENRLP